MDWMFRQVEVLSALMLSQRFMSHLGLLFSVLVLTACNSSGVQVSGGPSTPEDWYNSSSAKVLDFGSGSAGSYFLPTHVKQLSDGRILMFGQGGAVLMSETGVIDVAYGSSGFQTILPSSFTGCGTRDVQLQVDGKVLVSLRCWNSTLGQNSTGLYRLGHDLLPDVSFGSAGFFVASRSQNQSSNVGASSALRPLPDGSILVAYNATTSMANRYQSELIRLSPNGTLDTTFGSSGYAIFSHGTVSSYLPSNISILSNGKIRIDGTFQGPSQINQFSLVYDGTGALDTAYGTGGLVHTTMAIGGNHGLYLENVLLKNDNSAYVTGRVWSAGATFTNFIARLLPTGLLDTSFGTGGMSVTFGSTNSVSGVTLGSGALAFQSTGKLIRQFVDANGFVQLARYNSDGTLDSTFASNGTMAIGNTRAVDYVTIDVQSDDKILFTTQMVDTDKLYGAWVGRLNPDGTPDLSFGVNGTALFRQAWAKESNSEVYGSELLPDGSILAVIRSDTDWNSVEGNKYFVAKLTSKGAFDPSFGVNGLVRLPFSATSWKIALCANNSIVAFTSAFLGGPGYWFMARKLTSSGLIDTSFGSAGDAIHQLGQANMGGYIVSHGFEEPNGKLAFAGVVGASRTTGGNYYPMGLLRLTSSGALDTSFGTNGFAQIVDTPNLPLTPTDFKRTADGKYVLSGYRFTVNTSPFQILYNSFSARVTSAGVPDSSYAGTGFVVSPVSISNQISSPRIFPQADNKSIVLHQATSWLYATRILNDGSLDSTFGVSGTASISTVTNSWIVDATQFSGTGDIVITFQGQLNGSTYDNLALAMSSDGVLRPTFNGSPAPYVHRFFEDAVSEVVVKIHQFNGRAAVVGNRGEFGSGTSKVVIKAFE